MSLLSLQFPLQTENLQVQTLLHQRKGKLGSQPRCCLGALVVQVYLGCVSQASGEFCPHGVPLQSPSVCVQGEPCDTLQCSESLPDASPSAQVTGEALKAFGAKNVPVWICVNQRWQGQLDIARELGFCGL